MRIHTGMMLGMAMAIALAAGCDRDHIPTPSETPAEVIVHGRTSTLKSIVIVPVGKHIPNTYSGTRVANTEGFDWYVSQHYAFKTDYPEETARAYLTLLELAYPHYVEAFGREPAGIRNKRMTVVYGSTKQQMVKAGWSDGFDWRKFGAGGVTMPGHNIAYQYPSGGMAYHQRAILIHECTHLFQNIIGLNNAWPSYNETLAEWVCHHVYDDTRKQLTIGVLDKPTVANQLDAGLRRLQRMTTRPTGEKTIKGGWGGYDGYFMKHHVMHHSPLYAMKSSVLRDESLRLGNAYAFKDVVDSVFAPWEPVNRDVERWLSRISNTFHEVSWAFEQDGSWLWSRGSRGGGFARTDILLTPGDDPSDDGWRMDYPREPKPDEVGIVQRGVAEPSVGFMLDLSHHPNEGTVGIGLGLVARTPITLFPQALFTRDKEGTLPGLDLSVHALGGLQNGGKRVEDVQRGDQLLSTNVAALSRASLGRVLGKRRNDFVAEWTGWLNVEEAGTHQVGFASDDGGWLWIDDTLVIDHGGLHGMETQTGKIDLSAGRHAFRVLMFQKRGGYGIEAGWHVPQEHAPGVVRILLTAGRQLRLQGGVMGATNRTVALPESFLAAMQSAGYKLGMNLKIAKQALQVTLQTTPQEGPVEVFKTALELNAKQRERLLDNPMSILSQYAKGAYMDVHFGVMPFVDAGWADTTDPRDPASPSPYRHYRADVWPAVFKAGMRLGDAAPALLTAQEDALQTVFSAGADAEMANQRAAVAGVEDALPELVRGITSAEAGDDLKQLAVADLRGGRLTLDVAAESSAHIELVASLDGLHLGEAKGTLTFTVVPASAGIAPPEPQAITLRPGAQTVVTVPLGPARSLDGKAFEVRCKAELTWQGLPFELTASLAHGSGISTWLVMGPFGNKGWSNQETPLPPELEPFDRDKAYIGHTNQPVHWRRVVCSDNEKAWDERVLSFNHVFEPAALVAAYALTWVDAPRDMNAVLAFGSEDGAVVWVNRERTFEWMKGARTYKHREHRIPVKLKKGRNEILFKVVLGRGGWVLGAEILDEDGAPLADVDYPLLTEDRL